MRERQLSLDIVTALLAVLAVACSNDKGQPVTLDIATTTSMRHSGLLDALLPHYRDAAVHVHAAGSGRSLEMLADGVVDLAISHAPATEARYLAEHSDWRYRKFAFNHFVVVGPVHDPAHIRDASDALDAFRRIAAAPASFVSRGDGSGTHEREQALWKAAGVTPPPDRLLVSGRGMATALRHAQERQAYTLSDQATFWQFERELDLVQLFARDPQLLNTYAVVYPRASQAASTFAEWLARGEGRQRIETFRVEGQPAFTVWPRACPDGTPASLPCPSR